METSEKISKIKGVFSKIPKKYKIVIISLLAIILITTVLLIVFSRSPKSAVKSYIKAFYDAKAEKVIDLIDFNGADALSSIGTYSIEKGYTYQFEKFDEAYKKICEENETRNDDKKERTEILQKRLDELKGTQYKINSIKTEKVDGTNKLTKLIVTMEKTENGNKSENDYTFYTLKKGLKNYIIYASGF